ncbi:hypothetical protein I3F58_26910 [Streptomyces sp. MUM 203J]|uniref:hypothetical protein n=1 Tax=Streptomyces sp. MUM 203J TaxID=2791990 RepID=UPI001F0473AA|nr:hypothetical protein [Streptomyces sp. MUM 203J]MCH0543118.1 hypothetical protein [Streptomyces sp. MUM 203J]
MRRPVCSVLPGPGTERADQIDAFSGIAVRERPAPGRGLSAPPVGTVTRAGLSGAGKNRLPVGGAGCDVADPTVPVHPSARHVEEAGPLGAQGGASRTRSA